MAFQNTATSTIATGYEGDRAGAPFYPGKAFQVTGSGGVTIGRFCWRVINTDDQIVAAQGSNTLLAGLVLRSNANVNATQGVSSTYNMVIAAGQTAEVEQRGQYIVKLTTLVGSTAIAQGASVYVNNTDGTIAADGGGTLTGYTKTNFVFISPAASLTAGSLVKIENTEQVEG